jgi:hypothetical protein
MMFQTALALVAALAPAPAAAGPAPAAPAAASRPNCSAAQYRQLDFWVGDWEVFDTAQGYQIATSKVERILGGCSIKESYDSPRAPGGPYSGTSYSGFDRKDGEWHQMYVDVNGNVTFYAGGLEGPSMVLTAAPPGGALQRMTYRPLGDGGVQQIGLLSTDGGRTWKPGYDYTYRKK